MPATADPKVLEKQITELKAKLVAQSSDIDQASKDRKTLQRAQEALEDEKSSHQSTKDSLDFANSIINAQKQQIETLENQAKTDAPYVALAKNLRELLK